jgi:hypothetical protein
MWVPRSGYNVQGVRSALCRKSLRGSAKGSRRKAPGKIEHSPSATMILHATRKAPAQNCTRANQAMQRMDLYLLGDLCVLGGFFQIVGSS